MTVDIGEATASDLFFVEGEMSLHLRQVNWAETAFGPISQWSQSLKTIVKVCMDAKLPMAIWRSVGETSNAENRVIADQPLPPLEIICNDAYYLDLGIVSFESESALPQISAHQAKIKPAIEAVLQTGHPAHVEHQTTDSDQKSRVFSLNYSPLFDEADKVNGVFGTAIEITAQRKVETIQHQMRAEALEREAAKSQHLAEALAARQAAESASRLKDEFLAVVSHELRSPLNPILGCAKLLRKGKLTPERKEQALRSIERNAQLQAQLVNDLLDVSRILRGELTLNAFTLPVASAIQTTLEKLSTELQDKEISVKTYFGSQTISVLADPSRFQQIIWNLLSNAIKFTPRSGSITIRVEPVHQQVKISITDTGKGIDSAFLPYVFDRFRQEDATTTRRFSGLGLGLSIVRHLVELHGGTVIASSPGEDQGSTFTVFLPLGNSLSKAVSNDESKQPVNQAPGNVAPAQTRPSGFL